MKKKSILALILSTGLLASSAYADDIDELKDKKNKSKDKIEELEDKQEKIKHQMDETEKKISVLNGKIRGILNEINTVNKQVEKLDNKIEKLNSNIESAIESIEQSEKDLKHKKELLAENVKIMYSKGNVSYIEFLFRSDGLSDFLYRFGALQNVADAHKELYEEVRIQTNVLRQEKEELDIQKEELDKQKEEKEDKKKELYDLNKNLKSQQNKQLSLLKEQKHEHEHLENEISDQEAAMKQIENEINEIIKKREEERKKREENGTPSPDLTGSGQFMNPMTKGTYRVSSHYGWRTHPVFGTKRLHGGIDLGCAVGTPIYAADSGTVLYSGPARGFGNWIVIDHNNGYLTVYGHMYSHLLYVSVGEQVERGQKIGGCGNAGTSTGSHLHFEVHKDRLFNRLNPSTFISF